MDVEFESGPGDYNRSCSVYSDDDDEFFTGVNTDISYSKQYPPAEEEYNYKGQYDYNDEG